MPTVLFILQIVSAILFSLAILLQTRSYGLSATFGGTNQFFHEKRGAEKILSLTSIVLAVIFLGTSYFITYLG